MINGFPSTFVQDKWKIKGPLFFKKTKAVKIAFVGFLFLGLSGALAFFLITDKKGSFELAKAHNLPSSWGATQATSLKNDDKLYEMAFELLNRNTSFRAYLKKDEFSAPKDKKILYSLEGPDLVVISIPGRGFYKVNTTTGICCELDSAFRAFILMK